MPVAMIQSSFQTPLLAAVGAAALLEACCGSASGTAIALTAITMLEDPEHSMTSAAAANPLPEDRFARKGRARHGRGLDNSNGSMAG